MTGIAIWRFWCCVCECIMDGSFGRLLLIRGCVLVGVRWDDPMCYSLL